MDKQILWLRRNENRQKQRKELWIAKIDAGVQTFV